MRHLVFNDSGNYPITILVPFIDKKEIMCHYLEPWEVDADSVMVLDLFQAPGKKKTPVKDIKQYINEELVSVLDSSGSQFIICCDAEYFKVLTGSTKADAMLGYICPSLYGTQQVVYVPNFRQIFLDPPKIKAKIAQGMDALVAYATGSYQAPGTTIIEYADYPTKPKDIQAWLDKLLAMNVPLAIDIEAFSLKHYDAGIGTITFCWSKTEGIAFPVDYKPIPGATAAPYGMNARNEEVRAMLKKFFIAYMQKAVYHNIAYDAYVLIYQLFMDNIIDTENLLYGKEVMLRNWDCTKLITYLATNSCAGNELGLKKQAQEYAGNYAQDDIHDITQIPLDKLLEYNLVDGLSTWFTYEKHWDTLVADEQLEIYDTLFKPANEDIIQMQLTGMPMDMARVKEVAAIMEDERKIASDTMYSNPIIKRFHNKQAQDWVDKRNLKLKVKRESISNYKDVFNPNSGNQLQDLLFEYLGLPVIALTKSKQPSTKGKILKELKNFTEDPDILSLLDCIIDFKLVDKIITGFIPAFLNAQQGPDGWYYLFGSLNLGGTVSGRLSASDPNLQTIPSGSKYAKLIKSCFVAPPGWLFCGLDFASLEDRISALTTKDPNKLKVYTDGYDGHCLRSYAYFSELMPDIDASSVSSINSIALLYEALRGKSKAPTFLLTYGGTFMGLMKNCGFTEELAKGTEKRYHELYAVSDAWVKERVDMACTTGYVTAAFGLRVRTPLLAQVIRGTSKTPYAAEAEGRTAGNALGQSWCLLNNRAGIEFMRKVRASEYRLDIRPSIHIHDAQYFMIRDNMETVMYVNEHLVEAVNWQDHPDIQHPDVPLGGELSLFYPSWAKEIVIKNYATAQEITESIEKAFV